MDEPGPSNRPPEEVVEFPDSQPPDWTDLPRVVLDRILDLLPLADVIPVRRVCKMWSAVAGDVIGRWNDFAFKANAYQWESIRYAHSLYFSRISPREAHASCFHEQTGKLYIFGGRVPRFSDEVVLQAAQLTVRPQGGAEFNDLWSFDLHSRVWERVIVRSAPFPVPKSWSTLVAWRNYLVLYGGYRQPVGLVQHESVLLPREVHLFDVLRNEWKQITPMATVDAYWANGGGLHGHTAVVVGDIMVVMSGTSALARDLMPASNRFVTYLDLISHVWHVAPQDLTKPEEAPSGEDIARGTLVVVEPGKLLFHPCIPVDSRQQPPPRAYYLLYDKDDLKKPWSWRAFPIRSSNLQRSSGPIGHPVAVRLGDSIKLVTPMVKSHAPMRLSSSSSTGSCSSRSSTDRESLGDYVGSRRQSTREMERRTEWLRMEGVRERIRRMVRDRNTKGDQFYESLSVEPLHVQLDGITVSVVQADSGRMGDYKVTARVDCPFSRHEHSLAKLRFCENFVESCLPTEKGLAHPGMGVCDTIRHLIRSTERKRLVLMQADIADLDSSGELTWTEVEGVGPDRPPVVNAFSLVAARGSLLLTGGGLVLSEWAQEHVMSGGTFICNPVR